MPKVISIPLIVIVAVSATFLALSLMAQSGAAPLKAGPKPAHLDSAVMGRTPVAIVSGKTVYEDELVALIEQQLQQLRNQEYELKSRALDKLIDQKLLESVADRKSLSPDRLVEQEVSSKVANPSDSEIEAYYFGQHETRPLEDVKPRLIEALKQAKREELRRAYMQRLRKESNVAILLTPPKVEVGYDPARVRGNPAAPVTIIEFSDFECPYCRGSEQVVRTVLAKYGDKVKLAYRDFPLRQIHPDSLAAAEASRCAGDQGKFWEYHDLLLSTAAKLDAAGLLAHARTAGLNETQFLSCLNTEKSKSAVEADIRAGSAARVTGTPAFFVNGVFLPGAQTVSAFEKTIDSELSRLDARSSPVQVATK